MSEQFDKNEKQKLLFLNLVLIMQSAALQNMGRVENPGQSPVSVNLEQARTFIDILDMIAVKTRNNLLDDEKKFLENTLTQVKMAFVEETNKNK